MCPKGLSACEKVRVSFVWKLSRNERLRKQRKFFEGGVRSDFPRQTENDAFLDGNRRPDAEIRAQTVFRQDLRHLSPANDEDFPSRA